MALDQMDFCATINELLFMRYVSIFKHLALLCSTRYSADMSEVRWEMFIWHIILAIFSSTYQILLKLIEISRTSDRNNFAQVFLRHGVDTIQLYMIMPCFPSSD